jgi:hypothetical protein
MRSWEKWYVNKSAFFYNGGHALFFESIKNNYDSKPFQNNFDNNLFSSRKRDNQLFLFLANIYAYSDSTTLSHETN